MTVRSYELDMLGHVNHTVYHQYAEQARFELFAAAGKGFLEMVTAGRSPVLLETTVRFLGELRQGDSVEVTSSLTFGTGKVFTVDSVISRADGRVSAEVGAVMGVLDLKARRLLPDPRTTLRDMGLDVDLLSGHSLQRNLLET